MTPSEEKDKVNSEIVEQPENNETESPEERLEEKVDTPLFFGRRAT